MNSELTRQTKQPPPQRQDFAQSNNNMHTQNQVNNPNQCKIKFHYHTYYLQKHEIT